MYLEKICRIIYSFQKILQFRKNARIYKFANCSLISMAVIAEIYFKSFTRKLQILNKRITLYINAYIAYKCIIVKLADTNKLLTLQECQDSYGL